jgi:hypothetical protein
MHNAGGELPRILFPGTSVNKGMEKGRRLKIKPPRSQL